MATNKDRKPIATIALVSGTIIYIAGVLGAVWASSGLCNGGCDFGSAVRPYVLVAILGLFVQGAAAAGQWVQGRRLRSIIVLLAIAVGGAVIDWIGALLALPGLVPIAGILLPGLIAFILTLIWLKQGPGIPSG